MKSFLRSRHRESSEPLSDRWTTHEILLAALVLLIQCALALVMRRNPLLAEIHAASTLALGFVWALSGNRPERVVYLAAYIVGAEVLWRMSRANLPWEYGKYAIALILGTAMLRGRLSPTIGPLLCFALLLPSTVLTFSALDFDLAQTRISFNLSGHFALMICAWFFSNIELTRRQLKVSLLALLLPVVGISAIAIGSILGATEIQFTGESNWITSGGFGPNQVSSILGLGALSAFLYLLVAVERMLVAAFLFFTMLLLAGQSALTFSRGGLVMAFGAAAVGTLFILKDRRSRSRFILVISIASAVGAMVVFPRLDRFTGGALSERFNDKGVTGRGTLVEDELDLFRRAPVFGVGPGMGSVELELASHTEFSRLLAEHGLMGVLALVLLLALCASNLFHADGPQSRAVIAVFCTWACLFMMGYGLRLAGPSFALGLSFATLTKDER